MPRGCAPPLTPVSCRTLFISRINSGLFPGRRLPISMRPASRPRCVARPDARFELILTYLCYPRAPIQAISPLTTEPRFGATLWLSSTLNKLSLLFIRPPPPTLTHHRHHSMLDDRHSPRAARDQYNPPGARMKTGWTTSLKLSSLGVH